MSDLQKVSIIVGFWVVTAAFLLLLPGAFMWRTTVNTATMQKCQMNHVYGFVLKDECEPYSIDK